MATLTIRGIEAELHARLRVRAAQRGRSMEAEVRDILANALNEPPIPERLGTRIRHRFATIGGADLELPARTERPRAADVS